MARTENSVADLQAPDVLSSIKGVRDDMAAIFGPDQRGDSKLMLQFAEPVRPSRSRRKAFAALAGCGLVAMLTAGVFGGKNVLKDASPQGSESVKLYKAAKFPSHATRKAVAMDSPSQLPPSAASISRPEITGSVPLAPSMPPAASPAKTARPLKVMSPPLTEVIVRRGSNVAVERDHVDPSNRAISYVDPTAGIAASGTTGAQNLSGQVRCSTDYACLEPKLGLGEQSVSVAYERAAIAGIRPKILREYRAEWIRARSLARTRPQEAVTLYGLIGTDLRLLAADPTIE